MSANIILDTSEVKPQCSGRFWNLTVDNTFTGNLVPGTITPGLPGQFLATGVGPTVHWSDLPTQPIAPGAANSVLQTNSLGTAAVWNTNVTVPGILTTEGASILKGNVVAEVDLAVGNDFVVLAGDAAVAQGNLEVSQGDLDVLLGDTNLQNVRAYGNCIVDGQCNLNTNAQVSGTLNLLGDVQFNGTSPTVNQVPLCTGPGVVAWSAVPPSSSITPGTSRQILQTNAAGTASEWTSSIEVLGTLECDGLATFDSDINLSVGTLKFAGASGTTGNFVKSTGSAQVWSNIAASDVKGGTTGQLLQSDGTNAVFNTNITVPGTLTSTGTFTANNTANLTGDLQIASSSGTSGNFLKKTGAATQAWTNLAVTDVKGGTNGQVMVSNGTNGTFTTDLTLQGNLAMVGVGAVASLPETRVYNALKLGGNFGGSLGTVCVSDASSVPHWEHPQYYVEYYQNSAVDMNGGGNVLLLAAASVNVSNSNITYLAGVFTCPPGNYEAIFTTRPTVASGGKTQVNFRVNGTFAGSTVSLSSITEAQQINLRRTFRFNTSSTIEVVSQTLVAGVVNTSAADSNGLATTVLTIQRLGAFV
jgi:hypothetical protein